VAGNVLENPFNHLLKMIRKGKILFETEKRTDFYRVVCGRDYPRSSPGDAVATGTARQASHCSVSSSNSSHLISWIIGVSALKSVLDRGAGRLVHESCHFM
jgi:hypothetical protein